jgi:hypothetical protein
LETDCDVGGEQFDEGGAASLPAKLDRYGLARHRAEAILEHLDVISNGPASRCHAAKTADRLRRCGDYLLFRNYYTVDKVRLHAAHLCQQHLVCPLCAIRRSAKQVGAYLARYEAIMAAEPHLRPVFITYTVKNGDDLGERMAHLRVGLRKLVQNRQKGRKRAGATGCTWGHLAGAVGMLEATWNPRTGWHPHMHMVGLCDGWMDQRAMSAEWLRITGDSFVVGIQRLDPVKDPADSFIETFKYAVKFGGLPPAKVWEAADMLRGQRLLFSLGAFRGVPDVTKLTDEALDGLPFVELLYAYLGGGHYSLRGAPPCGSPPT